ncbi:MAG: antirestriction protein ArdA [Bacteroidales bacterium]|jgi:antirestriction protein|nr:antirestriction protein ArdA [Bacteroidales bacterium]
METIDLNEARIYVGTYAKYNNGSIFGKWFDLSDFSDKDDFMTACAELHKDETDPEFMFQDWENIPDELIGESWLSDNFFEVKEAVENLNNDEQEAFLIWCTHCSHNLSSKDINELISSFQDDYQGKFDDEEDYAYHIVEECYNLPKFALDYFDYEKFGRDLFMCDYWFEDGFVFHIS